MAGWYADAENQIRYWDGERWTQHVAPAEQHPVQQYQEQPYTYAAGAPAGNGVAFAGFVVGVSSVFLPLIFGLVAGVTGLALSIIGLNHSAIVGRARGLSIAGIVLSSLGIVFIL